MMMAPEQHQPPSLEHGRYVYCVVDASGRDLAASTPTLDVTGLEDEPVRLMPIESDARNESRESSEPTPAAVVHDCTDVYDTDDMRQIKRWVVNHQRVIDAAGDQFGTPLPFQFHTILRGTDDAVRHWLREQQQLLIDALESIAGRWEYRIDVIEREPPSRETLLARDPELAALQSQAAEASEGRAFLLEKQVEQGCKRLRKSRHTAVRDELQSTLADHADAVHELERRPGVDLGGASKPMR